MRILLVYPYVTYNDVLIETYPRHLSKLGHEIIILTQKNSELVKYKEKNMDNLKSIKLLFTNSINLKLTKLIDNFPIHLSISSNLKQIKPDIVHINNLPFFTTIQYVYIAHKMKIPTIVHVHGVIGQINHIMDFVQKIFIIFFSKIIFKKASIIICLTKEDAHEICRYGCPPNKIRIVPNGVDINKFKPSNNEIKNQIYWGGRFVPQKGLEYLIKAFKIIQNTKSDLSLVMTGNGPLVPYVQKTIYNCGLSKNVILLGRVPRDEIPIIINSSLLYVLPSLKEGMPYALLEAMSCGAPVVASNIPGIAGVIENGVNGILVPPRDTKTLASSIINLIEDDELRITLGRNARQLMISKYNWNSIAKKIQEIYNEARVV